MSILCSSSLHAKRINSNSSNQNSRLSITSPKHQIRRFIAYLLKLLWSEAINLRFPRKKLSDIETNCWIFLGNPGCDVTDLPGEIRELWKPVETTGYIFRKNPPEDSPRIHKQIWGIAFVWFCTKKNEIIDHWSLGYFWMFESLRSTFFLHPGDRLAVLDPVDSWNACHTELETTWMTSMILESY